MICITDKAKDDLKVLIVFLMLASLTIFLGILIGSYLGNTDDYWLRDIGHLFTYLIQLAIGAFIYYWVKVSVYIKKDCK